VWGGLVFGAREPRLPCAEEPCRDRFADPREARASSLDRRLQQRAAAPAVEQTAGLRPSRPIRRINLETILTSKHLNLLSQRQTQITAGGRTTDPKIERFGLTRMRPHEADSILADASVRAAVRRTMIQIRPGEERGHANHGWLDTHYTFSFSDYYDPRFMGFRSLRVINEDRVQPGYGFPAHPHRDMEIVTYVLEGSLEHKDSMGTGSVIRPGEVQKMSAGTGIRHSEFNHSKTEPVHLYQIWLLPEREGIKPMYEQKDISAEGETGELRGGGARQDV